MTTFFAAIILLAAVCPSPDVDSDWNLPDRSVACEKIDGYHECNDEIERLLIARHRLVTPTWYLRNTTDRADRGGVLSPFNGKS